MRVAHEGLGRQRRGREASARAEGGARGPMQTDGAGQRRNADALRAKKAPEGGNATQRIR